MCDLRIESVCFIDCECVAYGLRMLANTLATICTRLTGSKSGTEAVTKWRFRMCAHLAEYYQRY
jgi:hypothetical protein